MIRPSRRPWIALAAWMCPACAEPADGGPHDTEPADSVSPDTRCACVDLVLPDAPVTDEPGLAALLHTVQVGLYPEQAALNLGVAAIDDLQFFRAWTEIDTLADAPYDREYSIQYDPVVLADPPDPAAIAAVLAHELGHIDDYLAMDGDAMLDFGLWYASQDPATSDELAAYERATDEKALVRGCADGLSAMRVWIYAHVDASVEAEKRRNYYTPEEIAAWVLANGEC